MTDDPLPNTPPPSQALTVPWLFIVCSTVCGVWSLVLGFYLILLKERPRTLGLDEAGLFYLFHDLLKEPGDFYWTGGCLLAQGLIIIFIPIYFKLSRKGIPSQNAERYQHFQRNVPIGAFILIFAILAAICFELQYDTFGYILSVPMIILLISSRLR
jgi:hypothetical protein